MPDRFPASHWRERAEEARTLAEQMEDADARRTMLDIANSYDNLAARAEARHAGKPIPKGEM
jgi:hypothetical protein